MCSFSFQLGQQRPKETSVFYSTAKTNVIILFHYIAAILIFYLQSPEAPTKLLITLQEIKRIN